MSRPVISIIMPVYNGEKYLRESIDSILSQTFTDFELLVVNDGSTDGSVEIIQYYEKQDPRVKLIHNRLGKGIAGALNTGLSVSKGDYLARADADDINRPYRLKEQYDFLEKNKDIYLLGGGYAPFNQKGHRIDIYHPKGSIEIGWKFITNTYFCHPSIMMRREVYDDMGGYINTATEDYDYFSRIIKRYRGYNLQRILLDYREHEINYSKTAKEPILKNVKEISENNFRFYADKMDGYGELVKFQEEVPLSIKSIIKLLNVNWKILNRIRKQYKLSVFHLDFVGMHLKIIVRSIKLSRRKKIT